MAKEVQQRREFDLAEWDPEITGSREQKRFKALRMSGGAFSPREFGGHTTFQSTKSYLAQQTHGLPAGFTTEEKKNVNLGLAGGNMYGVLHN